MTKYQVSTTVPASGGSNRRRLSDLFIAAFPSMAVGYSSSWLPVAKLYVQAEAGASAGLVYLGDSTVDQTGAGGADVITAATASAPGGSRLIESQMDNNAINLGDYYLHGAHATDPVTIWVQQN